MSDDIDDGLDVLGDIYQGEAIEKQKAEAQANYEDRIVKKVMKKVGLEKQIPIFAQDIRQTTGAKPYLSFTYLQTKYPSSPINFVARRLPYIYQMTVNDLFNKFGSTKIVTTWLEEFGDDDDRSLGLIFDFPGIKGTQLICHNWDSWAVSKNEVIIRCRISNNHVLSIERFEYFLKDFKSAWAIFDEDP